LYRHPGSALTFRNLTKKNTASIRAIVEQREYFMQLQFRLPRFLRPDVTLPKCLDCDQLIQHLDAPLWLWHFQETQVKLHSESAHELWCLVSGAVHMTLLPEWTEGMVDHYVTDKILAEAPTYKDTQYFKADLKSGDCFYVPAKTLRQWEPTVDTMAVIFQISDSILKDREQQFGRCNSMGEKVTLEKVRFADDGQEEEGAIVGSQTLEKFISYLDTDDCLDHADFQKALSGDLSVRLVGIPSATAKELFSALDTDHDGEFCWADVDMLTVRSAHDLAKLVSSKVELKTEDEDSGKRKSDEL